MAPSNPGFKMPSYDEELITVVVHGDVKRALEYIDQGTDVNKKSQYGETLLIRASLRNDTDMVEALLGKGALINDTDIWGTTALMIASTYNYTETAALLMASGAAVNMKDNFGRTALMKTTNLAIVTMLIERGVDIDVRNDAGRSALDIANDLGVTKIAQILKNLPEQRLQKKLEGEEASRMAITAAITDDRQKRLKEKARFKPIRLQHKPKI